MVSKRRGSPKYNAKVDQRIPTVARPKHKEGSAPPDVGQAQSQLPIAEHDRQAVDEAAVKGAHEIIFVDASVKDLQTFLNGHQQSEVIILDPNSDGVEQIAGAVAGRADITGIHILSHSDAGQLYLGDSALDLQSIDGKYANELATIKAALSPRGIFCSMGVMWRRAPRARLSWLPWPRLRALILRLRRIRRAPSQGGDWVLETVSGPIETVRLALNGFEGVLTVAPTITDSVTTTRTTPEDTPLAITGITVADVEDPAVMRASITVTGGIIDLAGSGWTVTGGADGSSAVTIEGTVAQINSAINGMSFTPDANQNTGIPGYDPQIDLSVTDVSNSDGPTTLSLTNLAVTPVNDAPSIAGGVPLVVSEGGTGSFAPPTTVGSGFTQSQLGLTDVDTSATQTIIKIASVPTHGTLKLNGITVAAGSTLAVSDLNKLSYTHDGTQVTGPTTDSFNIIVDDGAGGLLPAQPVFINLTPVNQPPSLGGNVTIIEGETGVRLDNNSVLPPPLSFGRGAINVSDPEGGTISTYTVNTLPVHGTLSYDGTVITAPFVVADITKLTYSHDGSETTTDGFNMSVTDDGGGSGTPATTSATINLTIYPNDDDPVLTNNVTQTFSGCGSGSGMVIDPTMLQVTDVDSPDSSLTYTLTSVPDPALGFFALNGLGLTPGSTFTQADIVNGRLTYVNKSLTQRTDCISFTVKDGEQSIYPTQRDGGIYDPGTSNLTVNNSASSFP